ncbi:hypothetical protein BGZ61DRAFT_361961 [Ilyonectria robusta]|uniref:uncharacterized protein n=1 Tax=Ilyonectria robusta TaxID=1079257 RepID=UPI001E8EC69B|nr:uncharacterized protein BGZ61DRAFT_361961 [Ilyonectria robusta]KAH8672962.1 hypothetical protein BGZ61DRAFT_361961 [Ilyonectria robusta]
MVKFLTIAALATAGKCTLEKDVVVIGGGASGSHAAFRLREDYDKSILLIEKRDHLGGHVNTYDAASGNSYNYGVQSFVDVHGAAEFVNERLGVKTAAPGRTSTTTRYLDFTTGEDVVYSAPTSAQLMAALAKYAEICAQYEDKLLPSFWDFWAPEDIPDDLLLTFGDFVEKYELEALVPTLFKVTGMGLGNVSNVLTIWVMQAFGGPMARSFLGTQSTFVPASGRNQDIYDAFAEKLGEDVMYSATVVSAKRSDEGVLLTVKSNNNQTVTVKAKRLLLAIEPTESNLAPFNLDDEEHAVFDKFSYSAIGAGIVSNPSLPTGYSLNNLPATASPNNWLVLPELDFTARFDYMGTEEGEGRDYFRVLVIGDGNLDSTGAKELAQTNFNALIKAGAIDTPDSSELEFVAFAEHGPMHARVSADELKDGFIQDLYALQGLRSTWWTGGAWFAQFQTHLWWYNDILIPKLIENM